jgi:hypothetical protein
MNAENSTGTATLRVVGRPFQAGKSGNPGGRPKGLVRRVRELTRDGESLVDFMVRVFEDEEQPLKLRMEAAGWLADRGFGRATITQTLSLEAREDRPVEELSPDEMLDELARLSNWEPKGAEAMVDSGR